MRRGVDYSWGRPSPAALVAAGYTFAVRYLSSWAPHAGKRLTAGEARALSAAGLDVVLVYEDLAGDFLVDPEATGRAHAAAARAQAATLGAPPDVPIYFAIDRDPRPAATLRAGLTYLRYAAGELGPARVGVYGGHAIVQAALDGGSCRYGWQTYAWSDGMWWPGAQLRQVKTGVQFDGVDVDEDEAQSADFGAWRVGQSTYQEVSMAPTLAQLKAERWWDREIISPEIRQLGEWLCDHYQRPADAYGTKGNAAHRNGGHRSQEWILNSAYCTNRTYTVESGLTADQARQVAAFDFTPGTASRMAAICRRLDTATRAGRIEELVEWFGTYDGEHVVGFDNILNRLAVSDSSHLWHVHGRLGRQHTRDQAVIRRVFDIIIGEDDKMAYEAVAGLMTKLLYEQWDPTRAQWIAAGGPAATYDLLATAGSGRNILKQRLDALDTKLSLVLTGQGVAQADIDALQVDVDDVQARVGTVVLDATALPQFVAAIEQAVKATGAATAEQVAEALRTVGRKVVDEELDRRFTAAADADPPAAG
jgi:hypothetical protein